jgi:hypothetical protein
VKLALYGLLHLDDCEKSAMNVSVRDFQEQVAVYANCALTLSKSLQARRIGFTVLTNCRCTVEEALHSRHHDLRVEEIDFTTRVPSGVSFYSAHFKRDAYRYFATKKEEYSVMCDLDMVCINDLPRCLINNMNDRIPMCYDISDQVIPAYGHDPIIRDLEAISGTRSEGRWSGGEFIAGPPEFFSSLVKEIEGVFERYVANIDTLHHVGDESATSAALENMRKRGEYVADAGTLGIVGRFWSADVLHPQKPFEYFARSFLLHLPSDKLFLSRLASRDLGDWSGFIKEYSAYSRGPFLDAGKIVRRVRTLLPR